MLHLSTVTTSTDNGPIYPYSHYLPICSKLRVGDILIHNACVGYIRRIEPVNNTTKYYIRWFPKPPGVFMTGWINSFTLCEMFANGMTFQPK